LIKQEVGEIVIDETELHQSKRQTVDKWIPRPPSYHSCRNRSRESLARGAGPERG